MGLKHFFERWESMLFGFMLGVAATVGASFLYHQLSGMVQLSLWERAVARGHLDRVSEMVESQLDVARRALADGRPTPVNEYLANELMGLLYAYEMDYAAALLRGGEIERFNALHDSTRYLAYDLRERDFSGLDLRGARLDNALLTKADLSGADLSGADLSGAEMADAVLSEASLGGTCFVQANLSGALLTGVRGARPDFREAVLAGASMTTVTELSGARFDRAVLANANLFGTALPDAVLDRCDLTIASAVSADLSRIASMADAVLTGVNLAGARLAPERSPRAWLENAQGLDAPTLRAWRANGAVIDADEVLALVDPRIVAGFRAQIEANPEIAPERRHAVLLEMLQRYYQL